ncbi:SPOR domain-containing protein [Marinomonas sp.]|uniref:SPOR domain-containing protein n=1 Tax=Marinomonas sp. TaxID=1904862 RepID=UPI003BAA933E
MGMSKKLVVVMAGLSLGACSSVDEKNTFMTYEDLQNKVISHEEQWQTVQPKLDRIDELEAEVAALKEEKAAKEAPEEMSNNMATDESMPAVNVAPAVMATQQTTAPVVTAPVMANEKEYGVQVASYGNRDEAIRGWKVLLKSHPTSFDGLTPLVNQKEVNGRTMYQLKVGPFVNKTYSQDFCKMLKEKGKDCLVTQYNGEAFASN